jgi:hypothetical protein
MQQMSVLRLPLLHAAQASESLWNEPVVWFVLACVVAVTMFLIVCWIPMQLLRRFSTVVVRAVPYVGDALSTLLPMVPTTLWQLGYTWLLFRTLRHLVVSCFKFTALLVTAVFRLLLGLGGPAISGVAPVVTQLLRVMAQSVTLMARLLVRALAMRSDPEREFEFSELLLFRGLVPRMRCTPLANVLVRWQSFAAAYYQTAEPACELEMEGQPTVAQLARRALVDDETLVENSRREVVAKNVMATPRMAPALQAVRIIRSGLIGRKYEFLVVKQWRIAIHVRFQEVGTLTRQEMCSLIGRIGTIDVYADFHAQLLESTVHCCLLEQQAYQARVLRY